MEKPSSHFKNLVFLEAQTGSGKTYGAMLHALDLAKQKNCVILAYPTKNLVDQTIEQLEDIIFNDSSNKYQDVKIMQHTRHSSIPGNKLIKQFICGSVIIVTVHNYFQTIGDSFKHHFLFMLSYVFSFKTYLFIDEGHVFFQKSDHFIPLTHGFLHKYNENHVLKSSRALKYLSNVEKYSVSHPQLNFVENQEGVEVFESPQKLLFNESSTNVSFLNTQFVSNLVEQNTSLDVTQKASQDFAVTSYVTDLFLSERADVSISESETYENPYVICNQIMMENSKYNMESFQIETLKTLQQILHYNLFYTFCNNLEPVSLCTNFRKSLAPHQKEHNIEKMNSVINEQYFNFHHLINRMYFEFNPKELNSSVFQKFKNKLDKIHRDYISILVKRNYSFKLHEFENVDTNLFIKLVSSVDAQILTSYPVFEGEKIKSLSNYKLIAKEFQTKKDGLDLVQEENLQIFDDSESEEFLVETNLDNQENSNDEKPNSSISLLNIPPYTSYLVLFDIWILTILNSFENPVIFSSATFNLRHLSMIDSVFKQQAQSVSVASSVDKLDELIIITTNYDYFSKTTTFTKKMWESFGQLSYTYLTEVSFRLKNQTENDGVLFFLPNEFTANRFFEKGIKNKSRFFSKISNRNENFKIGKFQERGVHISKFSCRISSIQSSISCGLNLPNHPFLILSFKVYLPIATLYRYKREKDVYGAQTLDAYHILKQAIGRVARKSRFEKENPQVPSKRILFFTGTDTFPSLVESFFSDSQKLYKKVKLYDISDYEKEVVSLFRRNNGLIVLKNFKNLFPSEISVYFSKNFETVEDMKIFLFEMLFKHITLDVEKQENFNLEKFLKTFQKFLLLSLVADVSARIAKSMFEKKDSSEKNPYGIPSAHTLLKSQDPMKKNKYLRILYFTIKYDVREFLNNEKQNHYTLLSDIEKEFLLHEDVKNQYLLTFIVFKTILSFKNIHLLMKYFNKYEKEIF